MRPMPGMVGLITSGSKVLASLDNLGLFIYTSTLVNTLRYSLCPDESDASNISRGPRQSAVKQTWMTVPLNSLVQLISVQ
jgi:hypothetical protein